MKKLLTVLAIALVSSCSNPWEYTDNFYISFEEAAAHIIDKYDEPEVIRATVFYNDEEPTVDYATFEELRQSEETIRNVVAYWTIYPPEVEEITVEFSPGNYYTYTREYTSYNIEAWNQNDSSMSALKRYRYYGWSILRESRGTYQFVR